MCLQANRVAVKGSLARNLHRLRTVLLFVEKLMQNLAAGPDVTLSSAASEAYAVSLGPYHSTVMRATCNAGFLLLPTRHTFLTSIGETGMTPKVCVKHMAMFQLLKILPDTVTLSMMYWDSQRHLYFSFEHIVCVHAEDSGTTTVNAVCPAAMALIERIDKLYDKPMPASTNWF